MRILAVDFERFDSRTRDLHWIVSVKHMTGDGIGQTIRDRSGQTPVCDAFTHLCRIKDATQGRSLNVIRGLMRNRWVVEFLGTGRPIYC